MKRRYAKFNYSYLSLIRDLLAFVYFENQSKNNKSARDSDHEQLVALPITYLHQRHNLLSIILIHKESARPLRS